jgi:glutamate-1-semialdehyde 2,1-aminomutase
MPGGNSRITVFGKPHPVYARAGSGARITDVDGVERLDFLNNNTTLIHGHAHPEIVAAITAAVQRGTCFGGMPTELEIELAQLVCARNARFEHIRFMNSGTEAVMMAVQAARAYTGRPMIAKCAGAFHGNYDAVAVGQTSYHAVGGSGAGRAGGTGSTANSITDIAGTPEGVRANTLVIPFNDPAAAIEVLRPYAGKLACVLVDPLPYRAGLVPATAEFLQSLADFCAETGCLLVADEVSSFRINYHGAMRSFGFPADLTALGKIIGGGMPIGAVAGRRDVMAVFDPSNGGAAVPHAGAFNANPVSMAAGIASMRLLPPAVYDRLAYLGELARSSLRAVLAVAGLDWQITGMASMFRVRPSAVPPLTAEQTMNGLYRALLDNGILIGSNGLGCVSSVMQTADIDELTAAFEKSLTDLLTAGPQAVSKAHN